MENDCKLEDKIKEEAEEDEIIQEFPIFNSKRLEDKLYYFQYPLIPKQTVHKKIINKCLYETNDSKFQLNMAMEVQSSNFDQDRAEIMAQEIDGSNTNKETYFDNKLVDQVFLKSVEPAAEPERYAAMTFNGREVHLTQLEGIMQFWPRFPYLDNNNCKKRKNMLNVGDDNNDGDDENDDESEAEQITVKFKQNKSNNVQRKIDKGPCTNCEFFDRDSTYSNIEKLKLYAEETSETGQANNLSNEEYVRVLIPEGEQSTLPSNVMSLRDLRKLPIEDQCRLLLRKAQIMQFQQIYLLLNGGGGGKGLTNEILLKTLPKVAVLVRGNWIVKSEVLYPRETFSAISGVPAELMCRARDYILYLFNKNQYVERKKVSSILKIPSEEVKEIFTGISKLTHNKVWELLLPTDVDFITKHSELVQRQSLNWDQVYQQISGFLSDDNKKKRRKSKSFSDDSGTERSSTHKRN